MKFGDKFGKLMVVAEASSYCHTNKVTGKVSSRARWECVCECGETVIKKGTLLRTGKVVQCKKCAYANRKQSTRRYTAIERVFTLTVLSSARKRGIDCQISSNDFYKIAKENCYYCGVAPLTKDIYKNKYSKISALAVHGLDRVDNNKGYILENIVSCCFTCNSAKRTLSVEDFKIWISRLYLNFILKESKYNATESYR